LFSLGYCDSLSLSDCAHRVRGNAVALGDVLNLSGYAKFYSRSHDAVIRVFDAAGNVIETHEQAGEFREP
jgi:hypothetical protein